MSVPPRFSIVIPTYNRPERLAKCLESLARLDYPKDRFEVVVVDDESAVPLSSVVEGFSARLDVRFVRQIHGGPAKARNTGVRAARGDRIAFTDDDCEPAPDWLRVLDECFRSHPDALVGGHTVNALAGNPYSSASQSLIDYLYGYYNAVPTNSRFFTSNNMALSASKFDEIGGFDTRNFHLSAGEDREFSDRWAALGNRLVHVPEAVVNHSHHLTPGTFWKQHFQYGQGAFRFRQARAERRAEPIRVEPFRFYWGLIAFPFSRMPAHRAMVQAALFFVAQVANTLGFLAELRIGEAGRGPQPEPAD